MHEINREHTETKKDSIFNEFKVFSLLCSTHNFNGKLKKDYMLDIYSVLYVLYITYFDIRPYIDECHPYQ